MKESRISLAISAAIHSEAITISSSLRFRSTSFQPIAAYQLSIPRFPDFDEFPINSERAPFNEMKFKRSIVLAQARLSVSGFVW